jgi:hypothetical membrane protein
VIRGLSARQQHLSVKRWVQREKLTRAMILAGIVAVVVYGVGDLLAGSLYAGYSFRDQAISELSAFSSPVRPLMATAIVLHDALLLAFAVGMWSSSRRKVVRWLAYLLGVTAIIGIPNHTVFAMSSRWLETGFNDTMHIALTAAFSLAVVAAVVLSAVAYGRWYWYYAIATLLVLAVSGSAASFAMRGMDQNTTPWVGGFERINAYAYFAWLIVLAMTVLRHHRREERGETRTAPSKPTATSS